MEPVEPGETHNPKEWKLNESPTTSRKRKLNGDLTNSKKQKLNANNKLEKRPREQLESPPNPKKPKNANYEVIGARTLRRQENATKRFSCIVMRMNTFVKDVHLQKHLEDTVMFINLVAMYSYNLLNWQVVRYFNQGVEIGDEVFTQNFLKFLRQYCLLVLGKKNQIRAMPEELANSHASLFQATGQLPEIPNPKRMHVRGILSTLAFGMETTCKTHLDFF